MAPVVHGLEDKYGEYMNFVYLNVDRQAVDEITAELNINAMYIPTFVFIDSEGKVIPATTMIGSQSDHAMEEAIIEVLLEAGIFVED